MATKRQIVETDEPESVWKDEDDEQLAVQIPKKVKKTFKVELKRADEEDDEELNTKQYINRLQAAFKRRHGGTPTWAQKTKNDEESEDSLLKSAAGYIEKNSKLPKTSISTTLLKDFNIGYRSTASISVVKFHRHRPVLITGDMKGNVTLFKVSSEVRQNNFLQKAQFKKFPINSLEIAQQGHAVICSSSSQEYLMQYNMENGNVTQLNTPKTIPKQGISVFAISHDSQFLAVAGFNCNVYILHAASMEHIKTIALPSNAQQIKFFPLNNQECWIICDNGQIVISDFKNTKQHSFVDEGAIHGTSIAISNHGNFLATGGNTGVVNVYNAETCRQTSSPLPLYNINNLVTSVSAVCFNFDAQLLAMCSNVKKNQIRLVHVQSGTTFKNFPTRHAQVTKANCLDISPNGGYLAVGNDDGRLEVFNIQHYSKY